MKVIKAVFVTSLFTCASISTLAIAADKKATNDIKAPAKMLCEDFITLDDAVKPKVIYWAEGLNRKGKPEDAVVDIDETDRLIPVLVEECTKAPKQSLWSKIKAEFKKIT
jgi:acid stress chaperone HdeA